MRKPNRNNTEMEVNNDIYKGISVERYCEQAETTNQPIEADAPIIYTPRKDGVKPEYNVRTDRFELAQNAMDKHTKSIQAKRADWIKSQEQTTGNEDTAA